MIGFEEIDAIEFAHLNRGGGEPTLWKSYDLLLDRWSHGTRDRETALRLLFLAWFSRAEPDFLTGLGEAPLELIRELFVALDADATEDEEICFVMRVMADVGDWFMVWDRPLDLLCARVRARLEERPLLVSPEAFEGRGAFGNYFAHQARGNLEFHSKAQAVEEARTIVIGERDA